MCPFYFEHFRPCYFLTSFTPNSFVFLFPLIFPSSFRFLPSNTLCFLFSAFCHVLFPFPYLSVFVIILYDSIALCYLPSPSFSNSFSPDPILFGFTSSYPYFLSPFRPASSDLWTSVPCFWIFFSVAHPDMILGYSDSSLPSCLLVLGYH